MAGTPLAGALLRGAQPRPPCLDLDVSGRLTTRGGVELPQGAISAGVMRFLAAQAGTADSAEASLVAVYASRCGANIRVTRRTPGKN